MAKKKFKKQTKKQLAFYEKVVKRNRDFILNKEGVESFGVGYKFVNGKRTNTICLLVYVDNKQRVARRNRIPKSIEGIPTDVVEIPQVEHAEPAESDSPALLREEIELPDVTAKSEVMYESVASFSSAVTKPRSRSNRGNGPTIARSISPGQSKSPQQKAPGGTGLRIGNERFEPIMGGVPIHNPNTGQDRVGVLGAIVFDKRTDQPLGLSVAHAIGNQVGNKYDEGKKARIGDPINQPPANTKKNDEIGTLINYDEDYDAAIFELSGNRKFAPKMKGLSEEFDVNEPIKARVGMKVECPARFGYATGIVKATMTKRPSNHRNGRAKYVDMVYIQFDRNCPKTRGGDSGAVWVERKSKRPVGLHRGLVRWRFAGGVIDHVAFATSMLQLANWHSFRFRPSKAMVLKPEVSECETSFVKLKNSLVAFCWQPDSGRLDVKKFDANLQKVTNTTNKVHPTTGVAATRLGDNIYAAWRGSKQKIQLAKMPKTETTFDKIIKLSFKSQGKPALVNFKGQLVMAFTDPDRGRVKIAQSRDGNRWSVFELSNARTKHSPALLALYNKVVLCWIKRRSHRIALADLYPTRGGSFGAYNLRTLWYHQSGNDPVLTAGQGAILLGYTSLRGEMRVLESRDRWNVTWKTKIADPTINKSNPSVLFVDSELISLRPHPKSKTKQPQKK